eukprot:4836239-Amphidinium_carterae.1
MPQVKHVFLDHFHHPIRFRVRQASRVRTFHRSPYVSHTIVTLSNRVSSAGVYNTETHILDMGFDTSSISHRSLFNRLQNTLAAFHWTSPRTSA